MNNIQITNVTELHNKIVSGECDSFLTSIELAVKERRRQLTGAPDLDELKYGQKVWFNRETRPTYLIGVEAKIVKINRTRVVVELVGGGIGRFSGRIRTATNLLSTTPLT